ncbi:MAG: Tetraacyldisaccharide 4'-kinase [Chlamydiia bacterium]|nr:Tetraacyldisaccharide 4'-kinase [Chlamydiia bacterium]
MIKIENWVQQKQKETGFGLVKGFLFFLSRFYQAGVWARHKFYDLKLLKSQKASIPIISVGNIVCGGTGKSEFVYKLISDLKRDDLAILSRGYRSKRTGSSRLVKDLEDGDEPFMLQKRCSKIPVIVGKRREDSSELGAKLGAKAAILDDGMQYLSLKKDLQIVMVRANDPFGGGFVPFGMRRELKRKLEDADYIGIHGATGLQNYELVKRSLLCYSRAKCFGTRYCLDKNKKLIGLKVGVFCGVGNPQFFMGELKKLGLEIIKKKILADHQIFSSLREFCDESNRLGAEAVVCTTKDYIKLTEDEKSLVTPIEIDMEISYDAEKYQNLIEQINNSVMR